MLRSASDMLRALKSHKGLKPTFTGVILYRGPSMIDGSPIVAIANRIVGKSRNAKTGHMVQTFIIRADMSPIDAQKSGQDASICGDCPARHYLGGRCYVNVGQSVTRVYRTLLRERYAEPCVDYDPAILSDLFAGLGFRMGTYGDPCAVPFAIWRDATSRAAFVNGYTHQWRNPMFASFKSLCMASCDHEGDYRDALRSGWRSFRTRSATDDRLEREVICPASKEAGAKTSCSLCKACGGNSAKAKASIVIVSHGVVASRFVNVHANSHAMA